MENFLIREYKENDLDQVNSLLKELDNAVESSHGFDQSKTEKIFLKMKSFPQFYKNYIAENKKKIIGFISLIVYETVYCGKTALINELIVKQDLRKKGIGKLLIQKVKDVSRTLGIEELEVSTEFSNLNARKFYSNCGFNNEYVLLNMELED